MKKITIALVAPVLLAGCATLPPSPVAEADFNPVEYPTRAFATPSRAVDYFVGRDGYAMGDVTWEEYAGGRGESDLVLLVTADGLADDSLAAQQWRIELNGSDIGLLAVSAGTRYKCARGADAGEWTRSLCP